MVKKTIYFHIGTHKTGTTALQKFFVDNRFTLKDKGFIYDFYSESEMNQGYLINPDKWDEIDLNTSSNYIISGEDFYPRICSISEIVKSKLSEFNIHFIIYFKRQDLMKQSVYNQIVKMHGFFKDIKEDNHYDLDYYGFIKELEKKYPQSTLSVRVYEKCQFIGESIYNDFLNILDLEFDDNFIVDKSVINPSLPRDKLEFSRYINMLNLPDGLRRDLSNFVVEVAIKSKEVELFRNQSLLSPADSLEILSIYNHGNSKIAKEYLNRSDGQLFYEKAPQKEEDWHPYSGLTIKIANEIISQLAKEHRTLFDKLYNELNKETELTPEFIEASNLLKPLLMKISSQLNISTVEQINTEKNTAFSKLNSRIKNGDQSADILREVALIFEEINDINTAEKIMEQACYLRSDGPLINSKLEEYKIYLKKVNSPLSQEQTG